MKAGRLPVLQRLYLADELDETAAKVVTGRKDAHIQPMGKTMMPPDYRLALTECGIWLRESIPRHRLHCLIAAAIDLRTSFEISGALRQNAELAKLRAMGNIRDMYFDEKTPS